MRRAAEELLRYCLPPELLQTLDLRSLKPQKESYLDERLRESFADVVYICDHVPGQSSRICFLFEHKSEKPTGPVSVQLLRYMLNIWEADLRQKRPLIPVLPIVVYHGHDTWHKETLSNLIPASDALRQFIPDFDFIFLNLRATPDSTLLAPGFGLLHSFFLLLKYAREEEFLRRNFARIVIFAEQRTDESEFTFFYKITLKYLMSISSITRKEVHIMIDQTKDDDYLRFGENDHEVSLLHLLYDEEEIEEMKQQGWQEGLQKGLQEGLQQGLQQGLQDGLQQGQRAAVLSVLQQHPDWPDRQIAVLLSVPEEMVQSVRAQHFPS